MFSIIPTPFKLNKYTLCYPFLEINGIATQIEINLNATDEQLHGSVNTYMRMMPESSDQIEVTTLYRSAFRKILISWR